MDMLSGYYALMIVSFGVGYYMGKRKKVVVSTEQPPAKPADSAQKVELLTLSVAPPNNYVPDPEVVKMDNELDKIQNKLSEARASITPEKRKELEQKYDAVLNSMVDKFIERAEHQHSSGSSGSL